MKKLLTVLSCLVFIAAFGMSFTLVDENKPVLTTVYYWNNPSTQDNCRDAEVEIEDCQRLNITTACERSVPTTAGTQLRQINEFSDCNSLYYEPLTR